MSLEHNGTSNLGLEVEIGRLIRREFPAEPGAPEEDLVAAGVLDSLTLIQLLVQLEEHFGVSIPLSELELDDIRSIRSLARLIANRRNVYAAAGETN